MHTAHHPLPLGTPGTQRSITSFHFGARASGEKIYIQSALHADELPGALVIHHLKHQLASYEAAGNLRGEIVLVPVANPIGLSQHILGGPIGRFDLHTGKNFNRGFPDLAPRLIDRLQHAAQPPVHDLRALRAALTAVLCDWAPKDELEAQQLVLMQLAIDADVVLDLHCDWEAVLYLYTSEHAWPQIEPLARTLGARASLLADIAGGEPFDETCAQLWSTLPKLLAKSGLTDILPLNANACVAATIELRGQHEVNHTVAAQDAAAIVYWLAGRGVLDIEAPALPPLLSPATPLAGAHPIRAPVAGLVVHAVQIGDRVQAGQLVVTLINPIDGQITPLYSPCDGLVFARHFLRFATPGMSLVRVAGTMATRSGKLLTD